jgi:hypothetical protein
MQINLVLSRSADCVAVWYLLLQRGPQEKLTWHCVQAATAQVLVLLGVAEGVVLALGAIVLKTWTGRGQMERGPPGKMRMRMSCTGLNHGAPWLGGGAGGEGSSGSGTVALRLVTTG